MRKSEHEEVGLETNDKAALTECKAISRGRATARV